MVLHPGAHFFRQRMWMHCAKWNSFKKQVAKLLSFSWILVKLGYPIILGWTKNEHDQSICGLPGSPEFLLDPDICCFWYIWQGSKLWYPGFTPKKAGAIALMLASLLHFRYRDYFIAATNHILPYPSILSLNVILPCWDSTGPALALSSTSSSEKSLVRKLREMLFMFGGSEVQVQRCSGTCGWGDFFGTPIFIGTWREFHDFSKQFIWSHGLQIQVQPGWASWQVGPKFRSRRLMDGSRCGPMEVAQDR